MFLIAILIGYEPSEPQAGQGNIAQTPFNGARKTMFIAHGFTDYGPAPWMLAMKDELLAVERTFIW